ncbi:hypothetical protein THAOC_04363 [Thalassiosira oceanica]|uniref:Uncharacterized protein n=1 Tax=Thalassiosira oceanica TaxID=159749 RepID=K0T5D8_THAOC|nr:hypothetical protein THAOC_04363 [Thalassiosira oceanica]|eukprot:EJK73988.1 hypothetical protein THAOC_04363 [Thalassiosira oceanica]
MTATAEENPVLKRSHPPDAAICPLLRRWRPSLTTWSATAAALPRQTISPSCTRTPSLMEPANNITITTPMTGGQGKGAPAKAPPRQLAGQLSRRSTQNRITILQRAGGPCEPTRTPQRKVATSGPRSKSRREVLLPRHRPTYLHHTHRKSPSPRPGLDDYTLR